MKSLENLLIPALILIVIGDILFLAVELERRNKELGRQNKV